MHWTLVTLLTLCGLCVVMNVVQFTLTLTARTVSILICTAWLIQQTWWASTGSESFALFVLCDATIIAWFLTRRRRFDLAEKLIAATIPLTTALSAYAWLRGGHTVESWWINWWLVAGQMTVALPFRPLAQRFFRRWKHTAIHHERWSDFDLKVSHGEA